MKYLHYKDQEGLNALVSQTFGGWSNTVLVSQGLIDQYADLSGDSLWLHVDEARSEKESPFGGTVAHGFLILSLLTKMGGGLRDLERVTGFDHMMNYGSDKLRFLGVVPVHSEIYSRSRIKAVEISDKRTKVVAETHVHLVGAGTPVLIYELMFVYL